MASKRELVAEYGREDETGTTVLICPHCEPEKQFETLEAWKGHMQSEHGGYTSSEVAAGQEATQERAGGVAGKGLAGSTPPTAKPKRLSARARELNDKVNRCVSLVLKHIISGVTEDERQELEKLRADVTEAFVGIEFDFEERLFKIEGKWAILLVMVLLYTLPSLPSMKESIAKGIAKAREKAKEKH